MFRSITPPLLRPILALALVLVVVLGVLTTLQIGRRAAWLALVVAVVLAGSEPPTPVAGAVPGVRHSGAHRERAYRDALALVRRVAGPEVYLSERPDIVRTGRYSFAIGGRAVDFAAALDPGQQYPISCPAATISLQRSITGGLWWPRWPGPTSAGSASSTRSASYGRGPLVVGPLPHRELPGGARRHPPQ
ncbi:hypothetical protein [Nonomuraea sp. NPDC050783]|uniref:hypothetical protein n=1 Tax=Nonomuraea sp. NPDC050783 TaxID=3154634 RepID=UPI003464F417